MGHLLEKEIVPICEQLKKQYGVDAPRMIVMSVTKLISDRFAQEDHHQLKNPKGIAVSDSVTVRGHSNFFLVA